MIFGGRSVQCDPRTLKGSVRAEKQDNNRKDNRALRRVILPQKCHFFAKMPINIFPHTNLCKLKPL